MNLTPQQQQTLYTLLSDQNWRLNNLYWITNKDGNLQRFRLNWAQHNLHTTAHRRNNILKVRQLGISTYIAILILDSCLFTDNFRAGIIDRTLPDAEAKLDKIAFAFRHLDYLPPDPTTEDRELAAIGALLKAEYPIKINRDTPSHLTGKTALNTRNIIFSNGSEISIGTTHRGGTLQLLHVSELGSIAAHDPKRADEIVSGSFPTVGNNCRIFLESTHEGGKFGINYEQLMSAMDMIGKPLSPLDFKFYFFPWYLHPEYQLPDISPHPTDEQNKYFDKLNRSLGINITDAQKAWYIAMARTQRSKMRQEFPSTPDEAISPITDGTIYSSEIITLQERGHLTAHFEPDPHRPIYTTWDLGISDYMSIWWIQPDGRGHWLILDNYTANNLPLAHYFAVLREHDARWSRCTACILPHDCAIRDRHFITWADDFRAAGYTTKCVPRTSNLWNSIDNTRILLNQAIIHARCSEPTIPAGTSIRYPSGTDALKLYALAPPGTNGTLAREPLHNIYSHAADSLRTFADAVEHGLISPSLGWQQNTLHKQTKPNKTITKFLS